jgi:site-specific recombinase XerD
MEAKALDMEIEEKARVGDEEIFKEFCQNRDLAPKTVENYERTLQYYSDFICKLLEELLDGAEEEDLSVWYRKRSIKKYLNDFKLYLQDKGYTNGYLQNMMVSVKAFYNEFDIQLPRPKHKKSRVSRKKETIGNLLTIDDVRKFMEYCNNCYNAIITISVLSGMSRAELDSITFKHLYDDADLNKELRDIS